MTAFKKILVANRGEIALRVIRACRELGIPTVAVYSDADRGAVHVGAADEAYRLGPAPAAQSYLNVERLMEVAAQSGCDAVHPGYGFLAENARFARTCAEHGLTFIGPSADLIEMMGGKIAARRAATAAGIPVVPGTIEPVTNADAVRTLAKQFGYPIAIKAAAGGGGKGLKVAHDAGEVTHAIEMAQREASAYFGDGTLYVEKYLARPKHVEVQIFGDKYGNVVHFGERDCSMQRRHQKLVEETPASISAQVRDGLLAAAAKLARSIKYDSAGTIECLVDDDDFYFLEMNTRIQVEHTVTEMVWGLDLVKAQIRVAAGERLWFSQSDLSPRGHAIECRINAESPADDFRPHAGRIERYREPGGPGVRVDAAGVAGTVIPQEYDSLIGKLVVWGQDRDEARARMQRALGEFDIAGVETTIPFLRMLLADPAFARGDYTTLSVDEFRRLHASAIEAAYPRASSEGGEGAAEPKPTTLAVEVDDKRFNVRVLGLNGARTAASRRAPRFKPAKRVSTNSASVAAPMHGIVAEIRVKPGDNVQDGQVVAVIEAMKMMNEVIAHRAGVVASISAKAGDTIETGSPLLALETLGE
ncbi:MAG TPA: acetyl-CoA carboxylase biotin carboxylase subunit [Candidatus Eremiobacteraceae bacterium]|nr:acetyl-CoA carboxylase biotin carboxylase subunit [Candidatus Eremiobacteraceae bacterium]